MKFNELTLQPRKDKRRVGRGISSGRGKTAGRGTKGQGSRKSGGVRVGFEGGQMPLYMRVPKLRGFKSRAPIVETVYTGQLELVNKQTIDAVTLAEAGLISSPYVFVKLLSKGELKTKKDIKLPAASASAVAAVEKAGGSYAKAARLARPAKKKEAKSKEK